MNGPMISGAETRREASLITTYPPLEARAVAARPSAEFFPFGSREVLFTHLGRGAVWLALRSLGIGRGSTVAMPAYHCGSEVEAARLAGAEIVFYRVGADLTVDEEDLERAASRADAVYLISFFGFPIPAVKGREGLAVIEDAAHGLFSGDLDGPVGSRGDAAVFCPRKALGVPDGGLLALRLASGPLPFDDVDRSRPKRRELARSWASLVALRAALGRSRALRRAANRLLARASRADRAALTGDLTEAVIGEWDLTEEDMRAAARRPARLTERMVRAADAGRIARTRRGNYLRLLDDFGEWVPPRFRELPPRTVPLFLPVAVADRQRAIVELLACGVRSIEVWPVAHPMLDGRKFSELGPLRRGLLALPVHHCLGSRHLEQIRMAAGRALPAGGHVGRVLRAAE